MKALFIAGIVLTITGVISLAVGFKRGRGNLKISKRATLVTGFVAIAAGVILLATYHA